MPPLVVLLVVLLAITIVVAAVAWAWRHGTLHTTEQERIDMDFERIVERMDTPTGRSGLGHGSTGGALGR